MSLQGVNGDRGQSNRGTSVSSHWMRTVDEKIPVGVQGDCLIMECETARAGEKRQDTCSRDMFGVDIRFGGFFG